ncbi:MAG: hypothetical protein K6E10_05580 [Eubacterium sp.]|nr:hypothetical protein [Eubacterium sp.]
MSKRCRHISVRLNPDDPKHVHIIDVLDDLNLDVHKSKNRFLVNALVYYINSMESGTLTYTEVKRKQEMETYVTRKELEEALYINREAVRRELYEDIIRMFGNVIMRAETGDNKPDNHTNGPEGG